MRRDSLIGVMLPRDLSALLLAGLGTRESRLAFWTNIYNDLVTDGLAAFGIMPAVRHYHGAHMFEQLDAATPSHSAGGR